ncbi:MAG: hypothetical protein AMXMBFR81_23470 [Chthonomonas sp.]
MTAWALLYGWVQLTSLALQSTDELVQTLVLAPSEHAEVARSLVEVAPRSRLVELAKEKGFDVLKDNGPVFLVHRNFLSSGDIAFALEVATLFKEYEPGIPLSIEAFPKAVRDRLESKLSKAYEHMTGKKPAALPPFAAEPFPYLRVKTARGDDVATYLETRSFVTGYRAPILHPENEGFVAQATKPLFTPGSGGTWSPMSGSDAEPTLFYTRSIVEERRAIWAVELWTALRDRLADMRREYRHTIDALALSWLGRQRGFQGLEKGRCLMSELSAQARKDLLSDPRLASLTNPENAEVVVRYFDFHIRFEVAPKEFIMMNLGQILSTDQFPR